MAVDSGISGELYPAAHKAPGKPEGGCTVQENSEESSPFGNPWDMSEEELLKAVIEIEQYYQVGYWGFNVVIALHLVCTKVAYFLTLAFYAPH